MVAVLGAAVILGAVAYHVFDLWTDYRGVLDENRQRIDVMNVMLAEQTDRAIESVDLVLDNVDAELRHKAFPAEYRGLAAHRLLRDRMTGIPLIRNLALIGTDGILFADNMEFPAKPISVRDRDYFHDEMEREDGMHISAPIMGRLQNRWTFVFSQRLLGPDGDVRGVIGAGIETKYFDDLYSAVLPGPGWAIWLYRKDGVLLTRYPAVDKQIGARPEIEPFLGQLKIAPVGAGRATGLDDRDRVFGYRAMAKYPLVVVTSVDASVMLTPWRRTAAAKAGGMALSLALLVAMVVVILRQLRRIEAQAAALGDRERRLASANHDLERSNADLEQFAYVASHDLREPLRMINAYLTLIERRFAALFDDEGREFLEFAKDGAVRMDRMVLDLLAYSRIGRGTPSRQMVNSGELVVAALTNLSMAVAESEAQVEIVGHLPSVAGDASALTRLFQNLIGNALKYRNAERPPTVVIGAERRPEGWEFFIRDNGIGIAPEHYDRIFTIFQRLHPRSRYEGTGIGLAIARKTVEHHGGRIWVESEPGKGSTFFFTLPAS